MRDDEIGVPLSRRVPGAARPGPGQSVRPVLPEDVLTRMQAAVDAEHAQAGGYDRGDPNTEPLPAVIDAGSGSKVAQRPPSPTGMGPEPDVLPDQAAEPEPVANPPQAEAPLRSAKALRVAAELRAADELRAAEATRVSAAESAAPVLTPEPEQAAPVLAPGGARASFCRRPVGFCGVGLPGSGSRVPPSCRACRGRRAPSHMTTSPHRLRSAGCGPTTRRPTEAARDGGRRAGGAEAVAGAIGLPRWSPLAQLCWPVRAW